MDPISISLLAASTALGGFSAFRKGKAQAQEYADKAAAADLEAQGHQLRGLQIAEQSRSNLDKTLGSINAIVAERGGTGDSPTAQVLQRQTINNAYRNEGVARLGEMMQQQANLWQANGYRRASKSAVMSSMLDWGSHALSSWAGSGAFGGASGGGGSGG
jgi:hypothetical protein